MSDDLRLPRRGIEPRPSGFRDIGSTSRPSPLPKVSIRCVKRLNIPIKMWVYASITPLHYYYYYYYYYALI